MQKNLKKHSRPKSHTLKNDLKMDLHVKTIKLLEKTEEKNLDLGAKQKQDPVVDVTGDRSKVRCCKEQYCREEEPRWQRSRMGRTLSPPQIHQKSI